MEPTLSHEEIRELLGAFALDALDGPEAVAVQAHLGECPRCRDEVAQYQQTAAMLASAGTEAPPGVWDSIASAIGSGPPVLVPSRPPATVSPAARRRPGRIAAGLLAAAAAAAIVVLGVQVAHLNHRLDHVTATAGQQTLTAAGKAALLDPAAHRAALAATGGQVVASVVTEPSGASFLFNQRLPALPSTRTYQLWAVTGTRAVSLALLGAHPDTVAFRVDPTSGPTALALTLEPAGGSVAPTGSPVATEVR